VRTDEFGGRPTSSTCVRGATLGVVLVGSADPLRLRAWYAGAFGVRPDDEGLLDFGGIQVLIDKRDVAVRAVEPGRMIITIAVDDIAAAETRLIDHEVTWVREVESTPRGRIGTLIDPDGNYVQVMQPLGREVDV
jgi:predicted enzyme related to lactoylglutathione lyase